MRQTSTSTEPVRTKERAAFYRRTLSSPASDSTLRRNAPHTSVGSHDNGPVSIWMIHTEEDIMIASRNRRLMGLTAKEGA